MNILQAIDDPRVFGQHFRSETWGAWRVFLAALFGLPLTDEQLAVYQNHTGRSRLPAAPGREAWLICGRRAGKSFILATIAVFLACFKDWRPHLGPGEFGTIMIVARDRRQARVIKRFVTGLMHAVPMLHRTIVDETAEAIRLRHRVVIEIHTASYRSTRGYTIIAALLDEVAIWSTDEGSAEPDIEIINAIRPGMATIPGSMLLAASSPHARKGALWDAHRKHFGHDDDPVLVWQATTLEMNATVPRHIIDAALEDDPAKAGAEYLAQFRSDIESFVNRDAVEACVDRDARERPPTSSVRYFGFVDPSGGSSDSMTLAIAHRDREVAVLDAVREIRPPFSPQSAVEEFAKLLGSYHITRVSGDRYAGEWPREQFAKCGIKYEPSDKSKSELYIDLLPLINSGRIELLNNDRLISQLVGLERRTSRGGRDSIDHAPNAHDDLANAVAGASSLVAAGKAPVLISENALAWSRQPDRRPGIGGGRRGGPRPVIMPSMPSVSYSDTWGDTWGKK